MNAFTAPATYAEAVAMMGQTVTMPNGEVARIGGAGTCTGFHLNFVAVEGAHRWVGHWHSDRGFETEADRKARVWDEGAAKLTKTARALIEAVFPGIFERADRATLKDPARLANVAKVRLHKAGKLDYETCGRCGGTGHYSYNQLTGSTCFGCNGKRVVFPSDSKALKAARICEAV